MSDEIQPAAPVAPSSQWARDVALVVALLGVIGITVAAYFAYPLHEAGATTGLIVLSNTVSCLLGVKAALSQPGGGQ